MLDRAQTKENSSFRYPSAQCTRVLHKLTSRYRSTTTCTTPTSAQRCTRRFWRSCFAWSKHEPGSSQESLHRSLCHLPADNFFIKRTRVMFGEVQFVWMRSKTFIWQRLQDFAPMPLKRYRRSYWLRSSSYFSIGNWSIACNQTAYVWKSRRAY